MSSTSDLSTAAVQSYRGRTGAVVAMLVSYIVNPLVFPPLVYGLVLAHVGASQVEVAWGVGIGAFFFSLVPLVHVGWLRVRGVIESLEIRDRSKRLGPFLVSLAAGSVAFGTVLAFDMTGRRLLAALVGCHVLNTVTLFFITTQWKISVHCSSIGGAVGTLAFARYHLPGAILDTAVPGAIVLSIGAVLVPMLLWARVRSRAHTVAQAVAGSLLGLVAPYAELFVLSSTVGL